MSRREPPVQGAPKRASRPGDAALARPASPAAVESPNERRLGWEEIYLATPPAQQEELLALAERQGLLYTHQLRVPSNGTHSEPQRHLLTRLLAGQTPDLEAFHPNPVEFRDTALDPAQRETVAKALFTPDIFLAQGFPGTGKSRVVTELVIQAAARGQRILLLAPTGAALDRVLRSISSCDEVFPIRCLHGTESAQSLPPEIRALTLPERLDSIYDQALERAGKESQASEQQFTHLRALERTWDPLLNLAGTASKLRDEMEAVASRRERLQKEVEQEADCATSRERIDTFATDIMVCCRAQEEQVGQVTKRLAEMAAKIDECQKCLAAVLADQESIRPLVDAKRNRRWWTSLWWRANLQRDLETRWADFESQRTRQTAQIKELLEQTESLQGQRDELDRQFQGQRQQLVEAEARRRHSELDARLAVLQDELAQVDRQGLSLYGRAEWAAYAPVSLTVPAVQEAMAQWQQALKRSDEQRLFARQWLVFLQQNKQRFKAQVPEYVNVVAATISGLSAGSDFCRLGLKHFDLLILEEAEQVTEQELLQVSQYATRWVLVGEPDWRNRIGPRTNGASLPTGQPFQRLWRQLHSDPLSLPYGWSYEDQRLCCRMHPIKAEERAHVETERVADFPDIELRILASPGSKPVLAEILFPAAMTIEQAKEYVYRELQELPIRPTGARLRWAEEADRIVLRLANGGCRHETSVPLEPGVREMLAKTATQINGDPGCVPWQTCCLEFDCSAGWQRMRAEDWVRQRLGFRDLGRTVVLDTLHRMESKLATFLSQCVFRGVEQGDDSVNGSAACASMNNGSSAVEFIAVPSMKAAEAGRTGSNREIASGWPRKGGAGLELDLGDPRMHDRLPGEMRTGLPNHGFVNYSEGQAVVRRLASVAAEVERNGQARTRVAVLALYAAQAELIRRLLLGTELPFPSDVEIEVDVASSFRQREADIVLLSLTRSHSHRPVAFGENPYSLALALTRARSKLLLFGDPGTLMRRSQWQGPLEHLNEAAADQERDLIVRLVRHLQSLADDKRNSPAAQRNP